MNNPALIGTLLGAVAGPTYFIVGESDVPTESDCNYLTSPLTDVAAFIFGFVLIYKGFKHNDGLVSFIGSTMIGVHTLQFAAHKVT